MTISKHALSDVLASLERKADIFDSLAREMSNDDRKLLWRLSEELRSIAKRAAEQIDLDPAFTIERIDRDKATITWSNGVKYEFNEYKIPISDEFGLF